MPRTVSLSHSLRRRAVFTLLALMVLMPLGVADVRAELRLQIPDQTFGPPFYARIEFASVDPAIVPNNGEWAAIVIYRQEHCIPEHFNLLEVFDAPAAFGCPLNSIGGYEVWQNAPGVDPAPIHSRLVGQGPVPVWFVRHAEFQDAIDDGVLTLAELRALPSLREGATDFYDELLRPSQINERPLLHIQAQGRFTDGSRFRLLWTLSRPPGSESNATRTRIEFIGADAPESLPPLTFPVSGSWFDPAVPGQGLGIHPVRGQDRVFATWYTYGSDEQPTWYAMDTCVQPDGGSCDDGGFDGLRAELVVYRSDGGTLNEPGDLVLNPVGSMTIDFTGCTTANASYEVDGATGSMELVALIPVDACID
jgi:hypothetical protein